MQQISNLSANGQGLVTVQMTVEEYLRLINPPKRNMKKGLDGLMEMFHCSRATAFRIAHSDWFRPALAQTGRLILFDEEKAWELVKQHTPMIK